MAYQPKSYRKFLASTVTAAMVATVATPLASVEAANNFKDVNASAWYAKNVDYLVGKDVLKGYEDGTFKPNNGVTRAEAAKMIVAALGSELPAKAELKFKDTKNDMWYAPYVQVLVEKGIVEGNPDGTFEPNAVITRAALAKMVVKAYELKADEEANVTFPDVAKGAWYTDDILTLSSLGIVQGKSNGKFEPNATVTRAEAAAFLHRTEVPAERLEVKKPAVAGIKSVKTINDTKFEVTFGKAIDEDLAVEIEKSGARFVLFHGGQSVNTAPRTEIGAAGIIQSSTISFNSDYTKAEIIISDDWVAAGLPYRVALIDGDNNKIAKAIYTSEPVVLKAAAEQPVVEVNNEQDKIILDFKTKMDVSALEVTNYEIYENDEKVGSGKLADFVDITGTEGKWLDATTKTAVEFKLMKDAGLLAGKTYKIKVDPAVETDNGKTLPSSRQTITFKAPTLAEAAPVAKVARVDAGNDKIYITFDKDLGNTLNFIPAQFTVKKPGGKTVTVTGVAAGTGSKDIELSVDAGALDSDLTYTIDVPANGAVNAYYTNAANKETTGLRAVAQKDIEIKSMTAKFLQQADNKDKADLLLTFDQRPNVGTFDIGELVIEEGTNTWTGATATAELYHGDSTGKTLIIKDITATGAFSPDFTVRSDKTYTVKLGAGGVQTDAGTNASTNQEKLSAKIGGVSVSTPVVDKITLKSASEIEIAFKEEIDARNLSAADVTVRGYEIYSNGDFSSQMDLQGDSQLRVSASGKVLTVKAASDKIKFVTGFAAATGELFTIAEETFKNAASNVENEEILYSGLNLDPDKEIDRAAPVMIGAQKTDDDSVKITYSEAVYFKDVASDKHASQFTTKDASKDAYGINGTTAVDTVGTATDVIDVVFNYSDTFRTTLDLSKAKIVYTKNTNVLLRDIKNNEAPNQTLSGIKRP